MIKRKRNSLCYCGSGKKYKKCCYTPQSNPSIALSGSVISQAIASLVREHAKYLREIMLRVRFNVRDFAVSRDDWKNAQYDADRLVIASEEIHNEAKAHLRTIGHSRQYWYQLIRHSIRGFMPELRHVNNDLLQKATGKRRFTPSPLWEGDILRAASDLVLASTQAGAPLEWVNTSAGKGINFAVDDKELQALAAIISLAQLKHETEIQYRFACKDIPILNPIDFAETLNAKIIESIDSYEQRRDHYETLCGSAGLWYDTLNLAPLNPELCFAWGVRSVHSSLLRISFKGPDLVIQGKWLLDMIREKRRVSGLNTSARSDLFLVPPMFHYNVEQLLPYDTILEKFAVSVEKGIGIPAQKITVFLYALFGLIRHATAYEGLDLNHSPDDLVFRWPPNFDRVERQKVTSCWADIVQLALLRSSPEDWRKKLAWISLSLTQFDPSLPGLEENEISYLIDKFTITDPKFLQDDRPTLFTRLSEHTLVLDLLGAGDFIRHLLLSINIAGRKKAGGKVKETGDETGKWLEEQAALFFKRELQLDRTKMIVGKKIAKNKRQIDLAFVYRRVLFMIDCKAKAKDVGYITGHRSKIINRHSEFKEELLRKNPERVELIRQGAASPMIQPSDFSGSCVLVCTSAVEYLPLDESSFWREGFPLIGPPEELLDTIQGLVSNKETN